MACAEANQATQQGRLLSRAESLSAETAELQARLEEIAEADRDTQTERELAFKMALKQEQKERIRRYLEQKISDKYHNHYERRERDNAFL